jgi:hypothetical protein
VADMQAKAVPYNFTRKYLNLFTIMHCNIKEVRTIIFRLLSLIVRMAKMTKQQILKTKEP